MAEKAYRSIGDVLSLLREEFPDITISKIRFLESQGLLDPERTPSGYRKFYDEDVERLRWILHQQRENFLPLKVIKGRLEGDGVNGTEGDGPGGGFSEERPAGGPGDRGEPTAGPTGEMTRSPRPSPVTGPGAGGGPEAVAARERELTSAPAPRRLGTDQAVAGVPEPASPVYRPSGPPPAPEEGFVGPAGSGEAPRSRGEQGRPAISAGGPSGASLTRGELASASGLSVEDVTELEAFGLVEGETMGGTVYYDEESLTVASLAAAFRRFGIEARHLRLYRNASEREAGLFEQIVIPLLKQRNPESRRRAVESLSELARLGAAMRASLLRRNLRGYTGG